VTGGWPGGQLSRRGGRPGAGLDGGGPAAGDHGQVRGTVETADLAGVLRGHRESVPPEVYLRDTPADRGRCRARRAGRGVAGGDRLSLAHALAARCRRHRLPARRHPCPHHRGRGAGPGRGGLPGPCPCADRLRPRHGIPARYVSGYLFAARMAPRMRPRMPGPNCMCRAGLGRLRPRQPLLPRCALHPPRLGLRRAGCGPDPGGRPWRGRRRGRCESLEVTPLRSMPAQTVGLRRRAIVPGTR
jgi:hypothetical protein